MNSGLSILCHHGRGFAAVADAVVDRKQTCPEKQILFVGLDGDVRDIDVCIQNILEYAEIVVSETTAQGKLSRPERNSGY